MRRPGPKLWGFWNLCKLPHLAQGTSKMWLSYRSSDGKILPTESQGSLKVEEGDRGGGKRRLQCGGESQGGATMWERLNETLLALKMETEANMQAIFRKHWKSQGNRFCPGENIASDTLILAGWDLCWACNSQHYKMIHFTLSSATAFWVICYISPRKIIACPKYLPKY